MYKNLLYNLKGLTPEEFHYVQQVMEGMNEQQAQQFVMFYSGKRQSPSDLLLFTLLGLIIVAGVQRFYNRADWYGNFILFHFRLMLYWYNCRCN